MTNSVKFTKTTMSRPYKGVCSGTLAYECEFFLIAKGRIGYHILVKPGYIASCDRLWVQTLKGAKEIAQARKVELRPTTADGWVSYYSKKLDQLTARQDRLWAEHGSVNAATFASDKRLGSLAGHIKTVKAALARAHAGEMG